jgi:hypothetical protein
MRNPATMVDPDGHCARVTADGDCINVGGHTQSQTFASSDQDVSRSKRTGATTVDSEPVIKMTVDDFPSYATMALNIDLYGPAALLFLKTEGDKALDNPAIYKIAYQWWIDYRVNWEKAWRSPCSCIRPSAPPTEFAYELAPSDFFTLDAISDHYQASVDKNGWDSDTVFYNSLMPAFVGLWNSPPDAPSEKLVADEYKNPGDKDTEPGLSDGPQNALKMAVDISCSIDSDDTQGLTNNLVSASLQICAHLIEWQ